MGRTEDEFEETLSLIDLPVTPMSKHQSRLEIQESDDGTYMKMKTEDSDFNFGSLAGSLSTRMEMSTADELFLHGQILPLRLSVDSRMGRPDSASASDYSSMEFTSSRSSSYSSTSSVPYKPRIRNQFHAHPSPTPRIGSANVTVASCRKSSSSVWEIFRLGPVQTPGIDLKDLRTRNPNNNKAVKTQTFVKKSHQNSTSKATLKQRMFGLGGCTCSVDAVENVQSKIVVLKSASAERRRDFKEGEILEELKRKMEEASRRRREQGEEGFPRRRRTFEWLKQLPDGDLHSNNIK